MTAAETNDQVDEIRSNLSFQDRLRDLSLTRIFEMTKGGKENSESSETIKKTSEEELTTIDKSEDDGVQCAICMEPYEIGTDVTIGTSCTHMFHTRCIMKWMCAKHDFCPFCRVYLFDVKKFKDVAEEELTEERFDELVDGDDPALVTTYMGFDVDDDDGNNDDHINEDVDNDDNDNRDNDDGNSDDGDNDDDDDDDDNRNNIVAAADDDIGTREIGRNNSDTME